MSDVSVSSLEGGGQQDIIAQVRALMQAQAPASAKAAARQAPAEVRLPVKILPAPQAISGTSSTAVLPTDDSLPGEAAAESEAPARTGVFSSLRRYLMLSVVLTAAGLATVVKGNQLYGPEMYGADGMVPAAEAAAQGLNYAVFDLNLNIRHLRDETVRRMSKTPDVVLLGASHWQEAHAGLLPGLTMYNSHIHRDYWEDPLGVVEIYERYGRLPKRMIISIRDKQFTPLSLRKDYLWEPGIPYYRAMAERIGLPTESFIKTLPYQRIRALFSLSMLFDNFTRWYNAEQQPHVSREAHFKSLDTLLPDGSILWSEDHKALFTAERRKNMAADFAAASRDNPPFIDLMGVEAFDALFKRLKEKGVQVYLVHPPFNPEFYDAVQGTKYMEGLRQIEQLTQDFAAKYGFKTFGSFNPHEFGCVADDYIDAEHANPRCLAGIFNQFSRIVQAEEGKS